MKLTKGASALILAGSSPALTPAFAHGAAPAQPAQAQSQQPQPKLSKDAYKAIAALETAVEAKDSTDIAAKAAAANTAARSADDRYVIGALRYKAAVASKDDGERIAALQAMLSSGFEGMDKGDLYADLGRTYARLKQDAQAQQAFRQALQLRPNNVETIGAVAEAQIAAGDAAGALPLLQKGLLLQSAGGKKPPEDWYKRAVSVGYKAQLPQTIAISRDWVSDYPTSTNWSDALAIYSRLNQLDTEHRLDLYRLRRAVAVMTQGDYYNYADAAIRKGFSGEAKAVLEEGFDSNKIQKTDTDFSKLYNVAVAKTNGDKESLDTAPQPSATARQSLATGDAWYGYGDYARAVAFYRDSLGKQGADSNLANLHLGMALARQGDMAAAETALKAVSGDDSTLAKYWIVYVNTKS